MELLRAIYAPDSRGRHTFSERVDAATVPALQMLPNIFPGSPMILQSISCWQPSTQLAETQLVHL